MTSAMTATHTEVKTYAHLQLLQRQVDHMVRRTDTGDESRLDLLHAAIEARYIAEVWAVAEDADGVCRAATVIKIDWDLYDAKSAQGPTVEVADGKGWRKAISPDVRGTVRELLRTCEEMNLTMRHRVRWTPPVYEDPDLHRALCENYNYRYKAPKIKWGKGHLHDSYELEEFAEYLTVEMHQTD